jgi:hypothetical protein
LTELRRSPSENDVDARAVIGSPSRRGLSIDPRLLYLLVAGLSFAYFLTYPLTIGRADESHLLFEARRVFDGQVPYKDFFESLTPLSLYLFAAVYRIAGTTLLAARVAIALIDAVGCALLFHLARRVSGALEASLVTLILAGMCIPVWPYASPHWVSTALALLVATVTLAERWRGPAWGRPLVAGMFTGAAACVQQQRGAFLVLWLPLALSVLALSVPRSARWRTLATEIAWAAGGTAIVVLVVLGYAVWKASMGTFVDMVFGFAVKRYGPTQSGIYRWAGVVPLTQILAAHTWLWLLRISPLFPVGEGLLLLRAIVRHRQRLDLERACLCLLAVLMGLSVWYLPDFIHVSFVLPFLLIPGAMLLHRLRSARFWDRVPAGRYTVTAAAWLFTLAVAARSAANVVSAQAAAPVRLETAFGTLREDAFVEQLFRAVQSHLVREPEGRSLLYSFPNDAWLYLALPADNVTPYSLLAAPMFPPEDFQRAIEILRARRAGTVLLLDPLTLGRPGKAIRAAIEAGYDEVEKVGPYRIYVRRETRASAAAE